jgi:glycerol-3-phosphate acyltransferase PlsY
MSALAQPQTAFLLDWPLLVLSYLIGSIPWGVIVSRVFYKSDIRAAGSGNIGAANALRTLGRKAGAAILILDALKGTAAVLVSGAILSNSLGNDAWIFAPAHAFFAILGHCYTPWLRFRGGKGVATFLGAIFAMSWEAGLAFVACWLLIVLPTGIAAVGSLFAAIVAGAVVAVQLGSAYHEALPAYCMMASVFLIVYKHRENIARLRHGTENRLQLLKR